MDQNVLQAMAGRRSCRAFQPRQITKEELDAVTTAGTWAPTGMGRQSPVIVVVQDKERIAELSRMNAAVMGADRDPFYGAPTVLVVLADKTVPTHVEDGSLVMGNLLLAAHAAGLGACWIHRAREVFATPRGKELLREWGVPNAENLVGVGNCILGYPAEGGTRPAMPRKENYVVYAE
ncbi:MAG: nitroreductase family protein [Gemmiger sp.]